MAQSDKMLIVGTSLEVFSAYRFVLRAHRDGIPIFVINQGHTRADDFCDYKADVDCNSILQTLTSTNLSH